MLATTAINNNNNSNVKLLKMRAILSANFKDVKNFGPSHALNVVVLLSGKNYYTP